MKQESIITIDDIRRSQHETTYTVSIAQNDSSSVHRITLSNEYWQCFTDIFDTPEELIRASVKFLLEREPKESILSAFDLPVIQQYFSDYEQALGIKRI